MYSVFYDHIKEAAAQEKKHEKEILKELKEEGLGGIELSASVLREEYDMLIPIIEELNIKIASIYETFDFGKTGNPESGYELIDLSEKVHCTNVLIIPGFVPIKWKLIKKMVMNNMADALIKIVTYAEQKGITVTLEDFDDVKAPFRTSKELLWFLQKVKNLKITFDTGNFYYSEEDEMDALDRLLPFIKNVHLKDRSLKEEPGAEYKMNLLGKKMYPSSVGSGMIPILELVNKIKVSSYNGNFTAEHFGSPNQLKDLKESLLWMKKNI